MVSGQLPSEETCPRFGLRLGSRLGLVLGLGGNQTGFLCDTICPTKELRVQRK